MYQLRFVNLWQSKECRRAKYRTLRSFSFTPLEARRFRDFRLKELVSLISVWAGSQGYKPDEIVAILRQEIAHLEAIELSKVN